MLRTFVSVPLVATALLAQNTFIVPSVLSGPGGGSTATNRGSAYDFTSFWYQTPTPVQPVRTQMFWDVNDIPVAAASLLSISFRRPNSIGNNNPAGTATIRIDLSVGPNTPAGRSTTFANNLGALTTTVFSGNINLPADNYSGTGPAPFNVVIPFQVPFTYAQPLGQSLVADFTISSYTSTNTWYLDAVGVDAGIRNTNLLQTNCRFSNGNFNGGLGHTNPVLGGNWFLNYQAASRPACRPSASWASRASTPRGTASRCRSPWRRWARPTARWRSASPWAWD